MTSSGTVDPLAQLASELRPRKPAAPTRRLATVAAVDWAGSTVDLTVSGTTVGAVKFARTWTPTVGDLVRVSKVGGDWFVDGPYSLYTTPQVISGTSTLNLTSGQTETNTTISFGTTLGTASPRVVLTHWDSGGGENSYILKVTARSATQFTATVRKPDNSTFGASITIGAMWIAVG